MKHLVLCTLLPMMLAATSLKEALQVVIDGDTPNDPAKVHYLSGSIRKRPGRFGNGLLIERRTVNLASPKQMILGEDCTLAGPTNRLTMGTHGFAALPLVGMKENDTNCLSFTYQGKGTLTITMEVGETIRTLASLKADNDWKKAAIVVCPPHGDFSLKFRTDRPVILDELMFDRSIAFANTYHRPGPMRPVDLIRLNPACFNRTSGAFACWIKAPWLTPKGNGNACGLLLASAKKIPGLRRQPAVKSMVAWHSPKHGTTLYDTYGGYNSSRLDSFSLSVLLNEIKPSADHWYFLVSNWKITGNRQETSLIVNGQQVFRTTKPFQANLDVERVQIGYNAGSYTNGILDDIALFNRPLTLEETQRIVNANIPLKQLLEQ